MADKQYDYFISYNEADQSAAEWIAWVLEDEGYKVIIEKWDFKAGGNFAVEMDEAVKKSARTIAVLSQHYLDANFTASEWSDKFSDDPKGLKRLLVPVRVGECELDGILKQVIHIDLVGLDQDAARKRLLSQLNPGRTKPATAPPFPGFGTATTAAGATAATSTSPHWQNLEAPLVVQWVNSGRSGYSRATLEVHTLSVDGGTIESRALRDLPEALTILGRQSGLFEQSESIDASVTEDKAVARTTESFTSGGERGIAAYRNREIVSWIPLPHDNLGAVFDEEDVRNRVTALLSAHASSGLVQGRNVSFAVSVGPVMMLTIGSAGVVNNRTSASLMMTSSSSSSVQIDPVDYISYSSLAASTGEVADELTARLALKLASLR